MKKTCSKAAFYAAIIVICLIMVTPVYLLAKVSFSVKSEILTQHPTLLIHQFTWEHWLNVFRSGNLWAPLKKSLIVSCLTTLGSLVIVVPASYVVSRMSKKKRYAFVLGLFFTRMIPSVAIHMNREVNDKASYNKQVDMLPLLGGAAEEGVLKKLVAAELQVAEDQILGSDLFLCIREKAAVWGCNEEFISSGRLDDQQCVFGILKGFLNAHCAQSINVAAFFDNEEVGSGTKQGAASTFLYDVLHRIAQNVCPGDEDFHRAVASSFMFSADNAHAVHPNHPEYTDVNNCTYMNEGVVVKVHAGQKYTSDGMSMAVAKELAARAGVPLQYFANRSDKVGGSTLGNLAMAQVSMNCVDIGLPQLAMHSCYETAGARDIVSLIRLMEEFYASHFEETASGTLTICK